MADRTRRRGKPAANPAAVCRCPIGWPVSMGVAVDGELVRRRRHHLGQCGLPDETNREDPR